MSKLMKTGWVGVVVLTAALAGAQTENAGEASSTSSAATLPFVDGQVQEGATKAAVCVACHGVNGNSSNPDWPSLAGQSAVYVAEQLRLFKAGVRVDPVMSPMAQPLSDEDINDLAVYFQAQTPAGLEADPSYWQAGEVLYRAGDPARNVPACIACHGPVGRGNPAAGYPAVRAQHSTYTIKQLTNYANDARYPGAKEGAPQSRNGEMMHTIAKRLTQEDMRNLASYIQGLR
jgi:cytochrome c553